MTSFSVFERPTKKKSAAQMARNATPPTTMPAMAPADRLCEELGAACAEGADVGAFTRVEPASPGMGSPGAT